jgi:sporulation protein YlmC with PRC-barrel domain
VLETVCRNTRRYHNHTAAGAVLLADVRTVEKRLKLEIRRKKTMKTLRSVGLTCAVVSTLVLFVNGGVKTEQMPEKPPAEEQTAAAVSPDTPNMLGVLATGSTGDALIDSKGQRLGMLHDLLIDLASGEAIYHVFDVNTPHVPRKGYYPVPTVVLGYNRAKNAFIADHEQMIALKNASTISGKVLPGTFLQDSIITQQIWVYWMSSDGMQPRVPASSPMSRRPAVYESGIRVLPGANVSFLGLKGYEVLNPEGQGIGKIEDVSYNPFTGKIYFLYLSFEGEKYKNRLYPLPLRAFTLNFRDKTITYDLGMELLENDPSVAAGEGKKTGEPDWIESVQSYWTAAEPLAALRIGMRIVPQTVMRENTLLGMELTNYDGQFIGRIKDFVLSDDGNVPYAVAVHDGQWVFIPTTVITIDQYNQIALVDISPSALTNMPGYDAGALPDMSSDNWDAQILAFWASELGVSLDQRFPNLIISEISATRPRYFLASAVREFTARSGNGEKLGDIEDLLFNLEQADAAYIVVATGGLLDVGTELHPIPVSAVHIVTGKDVLLDIDRASLEQAPKISSLNQLERENSDWMKKVEDYWVMHSR